MSKEIVAFIDSDVIISSIISKTGASNLLINNRQTKKYISNFSIRELQIVVKRMKLPQGELSKIAKTLNIIELDQNFSKIQDTYKNCVSDKNDSHIIAGAVSSKCKFIISFNLKHYNREKIKKDFNISILTPGDFLQHLRKSGLI